MRPRPGRASGGSIVTAVYPNHQPARPAKAIGADTRSPAGIAEDRLINSRRVVVFRSAKARAFAERKATLIDAPALSRTSVFVSRTSNRYHGERVRAGRGTGLPSSMNFCGTSRQRLWIGCRTCFNRFLLSNCRRTVGAMSWCWDSCESVHDRLAQKRSLVWSHHCNVRRWS